MSALHASIDASQNRAVIGNGLVEMLIDLTGPLRLRSLIHGASGTEWIPQPPDFTWGSDDHHPALVSDRAGLWPDLAPPSAEFLVTWATSTLSGNDAKGIDVGQSRAEVKGDTALLELAVNLASAGLRV